MPTKVQTRPTRTFWWDRDRPIDADLSPLRAVIFDVAALTDVDSDGDVAPKAGLIDLVMSLFVAGVWVGVVSSGRRDSVGQLVRYVVGDGLVETIVTRDDLADESGQPAAELYRLALWELGISPEQALAVTGSARGLRAAAAAGMSAVLVTDDDTAGAQFPGAVLVGYDGPDPLRAAGCQQLQRRWGIQQKRRAVAA